MVLQIYYNFSVRVRKKAKNVDFYHFNGKNRQIRGKASVRPPLEPNIIIINHKWYFV